LSNFDHERCGGDIAEMLPPSCDTGYALLGLDLGGSALAGTAQAFGFTQAPPLDLPGTASPSFPTAESFATNLPGLAYSAIGQQDVRATALSNALVAAGIANGGVIMKPHLLDYVTGPDGSVVKRYTNNPWLNPLTSFQAAQIVPLMQNVVKFGTAYGVFPGWADAAAKTGTAQVGNGAHNTDDWMIAFAPATHPTVAIAVVLPFQDVSATGATVAGPIMRCLMEGALSLQRGLPASGTATTCPR
jgi:peptidoglycan glycosyltransferase